MKKLFSLIFFGIFMLTAIPLISASHFIVGIVNDAFDGTLAENHTIILWNPINGLNDNLTDIVGINGNSQTNNTFMIDCQLLNTRCKKGDVLSVRVISSNEGFLSFITDVTVSTGGFTQTSNITLNSRPNVTYITFDDSTSILVNEIDLLAGYVRDVNCSAIVYEYDGDSSLLNASAFIFHKSSSNISLSDDNNNHYSNYSCFINQSYGDSNESFINCNFQMLYYSNACNWSCFMNVYDNLSLPSNNSDDSKVNTLLAVNLSDTLDFGTVSSLQVSSEKIINVSNMGNIMINLSLSGYAVIDGDGLAMNCSSGVINISVNNKKFNLTSSNPGTLTLSQFSQLYTNLTAVPNTKKFNLNSRQSESQDDATNATYWRIYVPLGVAGTCSGNIVFTATQNSEVI